VSIYYFVSYKLPGTAFRGTHSRASVFNIFPTEGEHKGIDDEQYPAADSPAFFTIHNPLAGLEMEFSAPQSPPSPALAIEDLRTSQSEVYVEKRTPRTKEIMEGRGREGSGTRWDGADSKEMLARELGMLLQANPQFLRSMSTDIAASAGGSATQNTLSTQGHVLLEELLSSLAGGGGDYSTELVRPLSGHFSRMAHLEEQLKEAQTALESERNARRAVEDAQSKVAAQVMHAQEESRKAMELFNQRNDQEVGEVMRKLVHTLDSIVVNIGKGATPRDRSSAYMLQDTIEGLKEENATLDRLYRQTKAELEVLQQQEVKEGGGGQDSLRKKNQQLIKELELLHKDYEALIQSKGGSDDAGTDDSDDLYEDKRGRRKGKGGAGFLKRIMG
jgi:hypothetical protein